LAAVARALNILGAGKYILLNIRSTAGRLSSMVRNPRYDILFEPVRIGPVTARNRFYAVPHAAGMTNSMPHMRAKFRETKAEGGWGVVCTGYVSIHPSSDDAPLPFATLWDEDDVRWQAEAARRARRAGFDIVYVYAGMGYLPYEFLLPEWNQRTDAYGGSLRNRVRIVRELLEVTREAVGERCAVALRISLEELRARPSEVAPSEAHELVGLLADLPDLWDVKLDSSPTDCAPSRFSPEGSHEPILESWKNPPRTPVCGVGRFTSPDAMVGAI